MSFSVWLKHNQPEVTSRPWSLPVFVYAKLCHGTKAIHACIKSSDGPPSWRPRHLIESCGHNAPGFVELNVTAVLQHVKDLCNL